MRWRNRRRETHIMEAMSRTARLCLLTALAVTAFAAEVEQGVAAKNITTVKFRSESLGQERAMSVLLPADYDSSTSRYPVLYLLHGLGDNNTAWSFMTNLSGYAAAHRLIIVMPDGGRSWYVNSASDPKARFEDFVVKDVVEYVDSHYRTIPLRRARSVAGLSMGGYGAAYLGLKHYEIFSAIGAFSGAVGIARAPRESLSEPKIWEEVQPLFGPAGSAERRERDPFAMLEKVPAAEMPAIYIACGGQDFLVHQNRAFVALLASKKIAYEYREVSPRIHSWDFWDEQIRVFLGRIAARDGARQQ
jgi:S-formylglutathione hydrolase FrmB